MTVTLFSAYSSIHNCSVCLGWEIIFSNHKTINVTTALTQHTLPPTRDSKQGNKQLLSQCVQAAS